MATLEVSTPSEQEKAIRADLVDSSLSVVTATARMGTAKTAAIAIELLTTGSSPGDATRIIEGIFEYRRKYATDDSYKEIALRHNVISLLECRYPKEDLIGNFVDMLRQDVIKIDKNSRFMKNGSTSK